MGTMHIPREGKKYLAQYLKKCQSKKKITQINRVAESMESIADNISTRNESPLPSETTKSKSEA